MWVLNDFQFRGIHKIYRVECDVEVRPTTEALSDVMSLIGRFVAPDRAMESGVSLDGPVHWFPLTCSRRDSKLELSLG